MRHQGIFYTMSMVNHSALILFNRFIGGAQECVTADALKRGKSQLGTKELSLNVVLM